MEINKIKVQCMGCRGEEAVDEVRRKDTAPGRPRGAQEFLNALAAAEHRKLFRLCSSYVRHMRLAASIARNY
jgi:hypothetical protein